MRCPLPILLLTGLLLAGCVEADVELTLNVDGTGRARILLERPLPADIDPTAAVTRLLTDMPGVVAWEAATFDVTEDGRLRFAGTALFARLENFRPAPELPRAELSRRIEGGHVLRLVPEGRVPAAEGPITEATAIAARHRLAATLPEAARQLAGFDLTLAYRMPGPITEIHGFAPHPDQPGTATVTLNGERLLAAGRRLAEREPVWWLGQMQATGRADLPAAAWLLELYGRPAMPQLASEPGPDAFDFDAAFAAAVKGYPALRKRLGLGPVTLPGEDPTPPAPLH